MGRPISEIYPKELGAYSNMKNIDSSWLTDTCLEVHEKQISHPLR